MSEQKQHVDFHRKILLRKELLRYARPGKVYVPFIGDGDVAVECYADREVWGADIDPDRVSTASARITGQVVEADCSEYPYEASEFAIGDFDAYAEPYTAFRSWYEACRPTEFVAFFTDAQRQSIKRNGSHTEPGGQVVSGLSISQRRERYNAYWTKLVLPWAESILSDRKLHVTQTMKYQRSDMLYWGVVVSATPQDSDIPVERRRPTRFTREVQQKFLAQLREGKRRSVAAKAVGISRRTIRLAIERDAQFAKAVADAEHEADEPVVDALYEAAKSGNVKAIETWLDRRSKTKGADGVYADDRHRQVLAGIHVNHKGYAAIVAHRRRQVARLRLQCKTAEQIRDRLVDQGVVNPNTGEPYGVETIRIDLKTLRKEWIEEAGSDWRRHQAEALAEIRQLREQAHDRENFDLVLKLLDREVKMLGLDHKSLIDREAELRQHRVVALMEKVIDVALEKIPDHHDRLTVIATCRRICGDDGTVWRALEENAPRADSD